MASTESRTIKGGCHCGIISYTVQIPHPTTGPLIATRCNCTFCTKLSTTYLKLPEDPQNPTTFTLLSPASRSELGDYQPRVKSLHRYFCKECGSHVWMEGWFPFDGKKFEVFQVNLASVDQPQEGIELSEVKIMYHAMLTGDVKAGLAEKPYPGGLL